MTARQARDKPSFAPAVYTRAPHQTEGWIDFIWPADKAFERVADHAALGDWVPLVSDVSVTHPQSVAPGGTGAGISRVVTFKGGLSVVETIVHWDPPHCYAYMAEGEHWPLRDYVGVFLVKLANTQGGRLTFREYFDETSRIEKTLLPHGVVALGERALGNLAPSIGGTAYAMAKVKHVGEDK